MITTQCIGFCMLLLKTVIVSTRVAFASTLENKNKEMEKKYFMVIKTRATAGSKKIRVKRKA